MLATLARNETCSSLSYILAKERTANRRRNASSMIAQAFKDGISKRAEQPKGYSPENGLNDDKFDVALSKAVEIQPRKDFSNFTEKTSVHVIDAEDVLASMLRGMERNNGLTRR